MATSSGAVTFQKYLLSVFSMTCLAVPLLAQSSLDDVHIASPQIAAVSSGALSHKTVSGSNLHVIKKDVNLVLVPVSVTDSRERLVVGLAPSNFQIFEGKKPQQIQHFSSEDAPVSVGIIVDTSGSMRDKMDRVREAVNQFCEAANPQDEFFIITFSDQPRLATDFTHEPGDIEKELLFTESKGRTSLLDAVYMGLQKMHDAKYAKKALLIISDGGDNHSRYGEKVVKSAVKESDVMIYAIGIFDRHFATEEQILGPSLLSDLAQPTGGQAFTLENPNEMPEVAHHIGTELRTQYVLAYSPEDVPKDGRWHKISVKLKLPPQLSFLHLRAKTGYYAHGERMKKKRAGESPALIRR